MMHRLITFNPAASRSSLIPAPTISVAEWWSTLGAIAGRRLSAEEIATAEQLAQCGEALRCVADRLFGEARTDEFFRPQ